MASRYNVLLQQRIDLRAAGETLFAAIGPEGMTPEQKTQDDQLSAKLTAVQDELDRWERQHAREKAEGATVAVVKDLAAEKPWTGLGEQLVAIARAASPAGAFSGAGTFDPRLFAASGGSATVPADGGYLIRADYTTSLMDRAFQAARLAPLCRRIPIGPDSDRLEAPIIDETSRATGSRWGGVQIYRIAEAATVTASKPKLAELAVRLEDLMGLAYATERLLRDARALEAIYSQAFAEEFAFKIDDEIIRGSGAGECLGVLNSPALESIAKETGQAAKTIVVRNLSKMWARLPARSKLSAAWFVNVDTEPQLDELALPVGTAALEPRFVNYGPDGIMRIKGRPVIQIEQAETLGTKGDILLADLNEYLLIEKDGLQAASSLHVRFIYNEMTFRWLYRINGQPLWKSSLTPYKGTDKQSAFISLDTRA